MSCASTLLSSRLVYTEVPPSSWNLADKSNKLSNQSGVVGQTSTPPKLGLHPNPLSPQPIYSAAMPTWLPIGDLLDGLLRSGMRGKHWETFNFQNEKSNCLRMTLLLASTFLTPTPRREAVATLLTGSTGLAGCSSPYSLQVVIFKVMNLQQLGNYLLPNMMCFLMEKIEYMFIPSDVISVCSLVPWLLLLHYPLIYQRTC